MFIQGIWTLKYWVLPLTCLPTKMRKLKRSFCQTGKVDVMDKSGKQLAEMSPNDQLIFSMEKLTINKENGRGFAIYLLERG